MTLTKSIVERFQMAARMYDVARLYHPAQVKLLSSDGETLGT